MRKIVLIGAALFALACSAQAESTWTDGLARYTAPVAPEIRTMRGLTCRRANEVVDYLRLSLMGLATYGYWPDILLRITNQVSNDRQGCSDAEFRFAGNPEEVERMSIPAFETIYAIYRIRLINGAEGSLEPDAWDPYPRFRYFFKIEGLKP